jgi:hypothetical protein
MASVSRDVWIANCIRLAKARAVEAPKGSGANTVNAPNNSQNVGQRLAQMGSQQFVEIDGLRANPFLYKDRIISARVRFQRMIGENEALFQTDDFLQAPKLYVSKIPSTVFNKNHLVLIAIRIVGLHKETSLPHGQYVGALFCADLDCNGSCPSIL